MTTFTQRCRAPLGKRRTRFVGAAGKLGLMFLLSLFMTTASMGQGSFNIDFKQGANNDSPLPLGSISWINSILQNSNSRYAEGMSTLQRVVMLNLPNINGKHVLRIRMQAQKANFHAYDFITGWNQALRATAMIAPGQGLMPPAQVSNGSPNYAPTLNVCGAAISANAGIACTSLHDAAAYRDLPVSGEQPLNLPGDLNTVPQAISNYEALFGPRTVRVFAQGFSGTVGDNDNKVTFVKYEAGYIYYDVAWAATGTQVVIEFGAHIASGIDPLNAGIGYGPGRGASNISGGPYHVILDEFTGAGEPNIGNQDNQLQGANIILQPTCTISSPLKTKCLGQAGNFTYNLAITNPDNPVIVWTVTNAGGTNASIVSGQGTNQLVVNPGTVAGTFTVSAQVTNTGGLSTNCVSDGTVFPNPECVITPGLNNGSCPGSVNTYSAPAGGSNYVWTVTGNATIGPGQGTNQITVNVGSTCGDYTVAVSYDVNGCNTSCSLPQSATDTQAPVINATGTTLALPCNPTTAQINGALGTASATDNCGNVSPVPSDGPVGSTGCNRSQTRTWTVQDACGNTASAARTVTWSVDVTAPVINATGTTLALPCNPTTAQINGALGTASATDNCGNVSPVPSDGPVGSTGCNRSQTRTWTVQDACGNTASAARTVTWSVDVTAPVINATGTTLALPCNPTTADINGALGTASATDNCGNVSPVPSDGPVGSTGCNRSQTRTWTVQDACGNTASAARTVTWSVDVTAPVINATGTTLALPCNPTTADINGALGTASATDNCGNVSPVPSDGPVGSTGCNRSQTRTWTVQDACGNTASAARTVTWSVDVTAPVINATGTTLALPCNPTTADINGALGTASATDNCGNVSPVPSDGPVGSTGCNRSQTRTWTVQDACGNTASAARTVTWSVDVTAPVINATGTTLALPCNPTTADINGALGTASATDNCGNVSPVPSDGPVGSTGCNRSQTRTWTVQDACGNTASAARTVTWSVDVTAPVINATGTTLALPCNPTTAQINGALGTASATDNCGNVSPVPSDGPVGSTGCNRSQTRTWTVQDACGNTASAARTVTWSVDVTAPVINATGTTLALPCNPTTAQINGALGTASATDNCGNVSPVPSDGPVGSTGCNRSQTRTWTVQDACGNTASAARTVTWSVDVTAPVINATGTTLALPCNPTTADINGALGTASATDNCGNVSPVPSDGPVGSTGCNRSQTRTWTVQDACGNTASAARTVTWSVDVTAPVINATGTTLALPCNPTTAQINGALGTASATDNCGNVSPVPSDGPVGSTGCNRSQTRTWTVQDACGNTASAARTVTWSVDVTAPVINATGTTLALPCNPTTAQINGALGTASATDNCGNVSPVPSDGPVGSTGCNRSQTRTWTVQDACGNTASAARTVTWSVDVTAPVINATGTTLALPCNPTTADINGALGTASATDNCGNVSPVPSDGPVGSTGCNRSQTRTWTVQDACGNTASAARTVTWSVDVTAPVINATGTTLALPCNPTTAQINGALGTASATDNCGNVSPVPSDGPVGSTGCNRSQTRTWTVQDACGNTASAARTVTWSVDVTAPVINATGTTLALPCNPTTADINGALGTASATDNCGNVSPVPSDGPVGSTGCNRSQTRTWTVQDACGNTASAARTVTWSVDVTAPVINATGTTLALPCNPTTADINGALGTASATDNCGNVSPVPSDGPVGSTGCNRSQTRTWTVQDACGNTASAARTVTWSVDVTAPVINATGTTLALPCNPTTAQINGALGTASATDNCGNVSPVPSDGPVGSTGCNRSQTRTWTVQDACGNTASAARTVTWSVDVTAPVINATGTTLALPCNPTTAQINGALGTASATDNCGNVSPVPSDGPVGSTGCNRSQTRTWTVQDACGNTASAARTVTWSVDVTPPVLVNTPANVDINCEDELPAPANVTATDNCGNVSPNYQQTITPADCATGFKSTVTRTWTVQDACGNTASYVQTIRVRCCEVFCTYTQGAYGSEGGMACNGLPAGNPNAPNQVNTLTLITNAINTYAPDNAVTGNMNKVMVLGKNGNSIYVQADDATAVISRLPGGGNANKLTHNTNVKLSNIAANASYLIGSNGRIRNNLLSQTMTLGLNLGVKPGLGNFQLKANQFLVTVDIVTCGSNQIKECEYTYNPLTMQNEWTYSPYQVFDKIPQAVWNALTTKDVAGLFALANKALGGDALPAGVTYTSITNAVDMINNAFDECRSFVKWEDAAVTVKPSPYSYCGQVPPAISRGINTAPEASARPAAQAPEVKFSELKVGAYPNPYTDVVRFTIESPVTGQAQLEVFNMLGQKVGVVYSGLVQANKGQIVEYKVPLEAQQNLIFTLTIGNERVTGKVLKAYKTF